MEKNEAGIRVSLKFASVGLRVSGSHDLAEIAGQIVVLFPAMLFIDMRYAHRGRLALSESHKWLYLIPVDGSSVIFFSFEAIALFAPPPTPW